MKRNLWIIVAVGLALTLTLLAALSVAANPPAPGDPTFQGPLPENLNTKHPVPAKPIDQPNPKDLLRNRERQRLLEAGQTAQAASLAQIGSDRVLVLLVEFTGTDVFTWTAGVSHWDPLGKADPAEYTGVPGDCSLIITETKTFTYTGPLHNGIERPRSAADRSGDTIWTPDFNSDWFKSFMFGNGVNIDYTRQDGSPVYESFVGKSVKDFYSDLSNGQYQINGDVYGWLPLKHSTQYYDADECPGARSGVESSSTVQRGGMIPGAGNTRTLVSDALDALNAISPTIPGFDWHNYDQNGDGIIDRLWVVHAGYGEEDSTTLLNRDPVAGKGTFYGEAAVWSHSSSVNPPYPVAADVAAGPYIVMPENGGIGVFAHEYGHNLGADDLYSYAGGETSAGFWTTMADDWTGYPIGFQPPAMDPWHLDNWGWLNPLVITDTTKVYTATIGQASRFNDNTATDTAYRGIKIELPTGRAPLAAPVWQGSQYWWGGKMDQANASMTTKDPIAIPAGAIATLSFQAAYGLETEWDFLWVQATTDDGATWHTLTNTHTICTHDPGWIGALYGMDGQCGLTDYNVSFPAPDTQTFDLSAFAGSDVKLRFWYMTDWGTTYEGPFIDSVNVTANNGTVATTLFSDNAEAGDAKWNYVAPWVRSDGTKGFTHNYYVQWRNVNANGGYDSGLGDPRFRYGPVNTGMLVWYNNNAYTDNEIPNYMTDYPGYGPKGRMLVVDSHPDPYREPYMVNHGFNNEGGNVDHRSLMRDAPFTLRNTVDFTMTTTYPYAAGPFQTHFNGRNAVSEFSDAVGYYPGSEYVSRGPGYVPPSYKWVTKQWDASVVLPSKVFYGVRAPGYIGTGGTGDQEWRYECSSNNGGRLYCYYFGPNAGLGYNGTWGAPGIVQGEYGWHIKILEEAPDHTWAKVQIWNAPAPMVYMPIVRK
jgi:immune inhibitor A